MTSLVDYSTIKLEKFDIEYQPRTTIKTQVLMNFIIKYMILEEQLNFTIHESEISVEDNWWILHIDGASNFQGSSVSLIVTNFNTTNNVAKYEVLITGLKITKELGADEVKVFSDSQLVISQILDEYEVKDPMMSKYLQKIKDLSQSFKNQTSKRFLGRRMFELMYYHIQQLPTLSIQDEKSTLSIQMSQVLRRF